MRIDVLNYQNKLSQADDKTTLTMWYGQAGVGSHTTSAYFHHLGSLNSLITVFPCPALPFHLLPSLQLSSLHNSPRICTIHAKRYIHPSA